MTAELVPYADSAPTVPSLRTLGGGAQQAAAGNVLSTASGLSLRGASAAGVSTSEPLINWYNNPDGTGDKLLWQTGLDAAAGPNQDLVLAARAYTGGVQDIFYLKDYGPSNAPRVAVGIGVTPPDDLARLEVGTQNNSAHHVLALRVGASATGDLIYGFNSAGTPVLRINNAGAFATLLSAAAAAYLASNANGTVATTIVGTAGQTADVLQVLGKSGNSVGVHVAPHSAGAKLSVRSTSNGQESVVLSPSGISLFASGQAAGDIPVYITAPSASQTADLLHITDNGFGSIGGFNKNGAFYTLVHAAPADADVSAGQMFIWFDQTSGAAKLMVKAKDAGGTVRTGSLVLA